MRIQLLKLSLFLMGLSGIVAQIILLRELLISFLGNELTLGIILGNWLLLVAIGAFIIGKTVERVERKIEKDWALPPSFTPLSSSFSLSHFLRAPFSLMGVSSILGTSQKISPPLEGSMSSKA
jgi:hypothetical protein